MTNAQKILNTLLVLNDPVPVQELPAELASLVTGITATLTAWAAVSNKAVLIHAARIVAVSEIQHKGNPQSPVISWDDALTLAGA